MTVYHLVTIKVLDRERFRAYAEVARHLPAQFGGEYLSAGRPIGTLEGEAITDPTVLTRWPSMEALERFWFSPEYKQVKRMRDGAAEVSSTILQGLEANDDREKT